MRLCPPLKSSLRRSRANDLLCPLRGHVRFLSVATIQGRCDLVRHRVLYSSWGLSQPRAMGSKTEFWPICSPGRGAVLQSKKGITRMSSSHSS